MEQETNLVKEVKPDFTGKGIGLILAASFLVEQAGQILKTDSTWYKYENKQLLNNLLIKNYDLLKEEKKLFSLLQNEEVVQEIKEVVKDNTLETEDIVSALSVEKNIFINFMYLFLSGTDKSIQDLDVILESFKNRLSVFTENDLVQILKDFAQQVSIVKYDDDYFKTFIDKYKG